MRFREKEHLIDFPVFGYKVYVIITTDVKRSRDKRDILIGNKFEGNCSALHSYDPDYPGSWIFLPVLRDVDFIVHESFHCIKRMLEWCSVKMENETYAFHLGYLSNQIYKLYK